MNLNEVEKLYIDEDLKNSIKKLSDLINNVKIDINTEKIKGNMDEQLKIVKSISKYGFLMPLEFGSDECEHWMNYTNKKELEEILINFFIKNKQKHLIKLKKKFNNKQELDKYKKVYNQAYYSYNKKKYYSSCIILTAILEGLIRNYAELSVNGKYNVSGSINRELNKKYKNKYSIGFQDKTGISVFIESYFSSIKVHDINNNNYFKRNVLMHGLDFKRFKRIDAIKLFNIIDIFNNLMLENY